MKIPKLILTAITACALCGTFANAQTFTYTPGDLLLGFRAPGGSSDLVVDIGSASQYVNATGPITISGFYYTSAQLFDAGISSTNLYFSVFGDLNHNLWATEPRSDIGTQSSPWTAHSFTGQGTTAGRIESIAHGALDISTNGIGPDNTTTAVVMPSSYNFGGSDVSYTIGIGSGGNLGNTFQGNIENLTFVGFDLGTTPLISDLYELDTANNGQPGTYLGYFELDPNGTLTFNPVAVPEPAPIAILAAGLGFVAFQRFRRKN